VSVNFLRFTDLVARGILKNRVTLANWIKHGFPPGRLIGPNTRAWTEEEIETYLASRPAAPTATSLTRARKRKTPKRRP
jgi:predicted DNA-binding transcriptional regulator AlpA